MHQKYEYYAHSKTAEHTCCIRVATWNCLLALCTQACALMYSKVTCVRRMHSVSRRRHVSAATLGGAATTWRTGRQSVNLALTMQFEGRKLQMNSRYIVYLKSPRKSWKLGARDEIPVVVYQIIKNTDRRRQFRLSR